MGGTLYVVAVPIGNLEDITLRALRVLREAPVIACEDTRQTGQLLKLLGIERPAQLLSVHDHNEAERVPRVLRTLDEGQDIALVSDAGTPAVSDPGFRVVRAALDAGHAVVPIPGVSAVITALCAAGLPTDQFHFAGFLPAKSGARRAALAAFAGASTTLVFYESPHRLEALLADARDVLGGARPAVIARELTKKFEEFRRGTLATLAADPGVVRGEIVLLIGGTVEEAPSEASLQDTVRSLLADGYSASRAAKEAAKRTGASRNAAYAAVLAQREEAGE